MRSDPVTAYRFIVNIIGIEESAGFMSVGGLQIETEYEEYREGGVNDFVHRLPKRTFSPVLSFKRGVSNSGQLWNWYSDVVNGTVVRRKGSVVMLNTDGTEACRWNFVNAYPVKWVGSELDAKSSGVAIETMELAHEGIKVVY